MPIRISQLPTATSIGGEEFIVIVQNGITKKISIGETLLEGAQGPAGTGYVFKGNWSSVTGYVVNDVVVYNGSSYVSKTNSNVNHTPGDNTYWGVVALKGDTGATGPAGVGTQGPQGAQGIQGPAGSLNLDSSVTNNLPEFKPTLDINFEHQGILDGRVTLSRDCEATYFDEFGILKIAATDEPVFDKNSETGESKGLYIAGPSTDLLYFSNKNDFSAWTKTNATIDSNVEVAPDGTLTADRLSANATAAQHVITEGTTFYATNRKDYTFSVFAKKGSREHAQDIIQLLFASSVFGSPFANFDLANGKITRVSSNARAQMIKLPNDWYRIAITVQAQVSTNATNGGQIVFCNNNPISDYYFSHVGATTQDVFIWGPQHEEGAKLTPYKYTNNAVTYSQAVQAWTLTNVTTSVNSGYAPDGTFTAERVIESATNTQHWVQKSSNVTPATGQVATAIIYAKKGIGSSAPENFHFRPSSSGNFSGGWGANFNIASGVVNSVQGNASGSIEHVGNGWYKCTVSAITTVAHTLSPLIALVNNSTTEQGTVTYSGSTDSDIFLWGLHVVIGYNVPEYIRNPEIATINTANKLPLKEGSLVIKAEVTQEQTAFDTRANETNVMQSSHYLFDNKSANNRLSLYARKPNNLINTSYSLISKNMITNSEGDSATYTGAGSIPTLVKDGIQGFDNSFQYTSGAVLISSQINFSKSVSPNPFASGEIATFSVYIQMDDGSMPVIASSTSDASGNFSFLMESSGVFSGSSGVVELVSGSLYRCSVSRVMTGVGTTYGVYRYSTQSGKGFKTTGWQLEFGSSATAYQKRSGTDAWARLATNWKPDQIPAPFGVELADRVLETSASGIHAVYIPYMPKHLHSYLYSVYLKKGVGVSAPDIIKLTLSREGVYSNTTWADFNLASGAVEFSTGCVASIEDASNGWYRCSIAFVPTQRANNALEGQDYIYIQFTNNTIGGLPSGQIYTGSVDRDIFAWGAQLQEHESILPEYASTWPLSSDLNGTVGTALFSRSSSATIDSVDYGVDAPRYVSSGILVEEGTTNLLLNTDGASGNYSTFSNVSMATTPLNNFINSVQFGDNSVTRSLYKSFTPIIGIPYTFSVYVQMDDASIPRIGTTSDTDFACGLRNTGDLNIELVSGALYRVSSTKIETFSAITNAFVIKSTTNSGKSFRVAGFQLEQKPYSTSYAESGATNFIRSAESLSIPTAGINNTAWTLNLTVDRATTGLQSATNTLCEAVIDSNNSYRLVLDASGRISALITSNGEVYAGVTSKALQYKVPSQIQWQVNGSIARLTVDGVQLATWSYEKPSGLMPSDFVIPGVVSAVYSNFTIDSKAFILMPFEHGYAPVYTAELTDASGVVNRAEYQKILTQGTHKFGVTWGPSYVEGNTSNLFSDTRETLAAYTDSSVSAAVVPIGGFTDSVQFGDNTVARYAYKTTNYQYGKEYIFSCYVQMDDNSVPVVGGQTSGADFVIVLNNALRSLTISAVVELVSGSLYKVSLPWIADGTTAAVANNGINKYAQNSSKGFRVAGYSITRKTTVLGDKKIKLFIDGQEVANKVILNEPTALSATSFLGSDVSSQNQWDGCIARLSVYPRKLEDIVIETITE